MTQNVPLDAYATVILNAQGGGTVQVGPNVPGVVWFPSTAAVSTSTATNVPLAYLYQGISANASSLISATYTGSADSTDLPGQPMYAGTLLICAWVGGDVGATATLSVFGSMQIPGH
jgi:hypothetical protein